MSTLLEKVKANLILEHDADDELLQRLIDAAVSYAESYQHLTASITIGGKEYELVLTTGATKQIAKRYGGLASLGDKLMKAENFENAFTA